MTVLWNMKLIKILSLQRTKIPKLHELRSQNWTPPKLNCNLLLQPHQWAFPDTSTYKYDEFCNSRITPAETGIEFYQIRKW